VKPRGIALCSANGRIYDLLHQGKANIPDLARTLLYDAQGQAPSAPWAAAKAGDALTAPFRCALLQTARHFSFCLVASD
jgi:hypothetical protein